MATDGSGFTSLDPNPDPAEGAECVLKFAKVGARRGQWIGGSELGSVGTAEKAVYRLAMSQASALGWKKPQGVAVWPWRALFFRTWLRPRTPDTCQI